MLHTEFTELFYISVFHFLWLAVIPWSLWIAVERIWLKDQPSRRYFGNLACLFAISLMLPVAMLLATGATTNQPESETSTASSSKTLATSPAAVASSTNTELQRTEMPLANRLNHVEPETESRTLSLVLAGHVEQASPYIFLAYLFGVVVFSIRFLNGFRRVHSLRRNASVANDHPVIDIANQMAKRIGMTATPLVCWCSETAVPMVAGIIRPVVLLPLQFASDTARDKLEHILLHEFCHIRRFDPVFNCFQNLAETLLFFNPLVWLVSRNARLQREISCDAKVIKHGIDAHQYAQTLTEVASAAYERMQSKTPILAVAATSGKSSLRQRIEILISRKTHSSSSSDAVTMTLLALATSLLLGLTFLPGVLSAQQQEEESEIPIEQKIAHLQNLPEDEFAGFVKDEAGNPIAGAKIDAWHWSPGNETTTDSDGYFRLKPSRKRPNTRVEIRISKPGYAPYYNHLQTIGIKDFVATLDQTTFVEGIVKDAKGNPVSATKVIFSQGQKQADGVVISSVPSITTTNEDGRYRIYLAPDSYKVQIQCPQGYANTTATVDKGKSSTLNLLVRQGVKFEALVVDAETGKPFEGLVLFRWREPKLNAVSDKDGKIVFEGLIADKLEFNIGQGKRKKSGGSSYYTHGILGRWWSDAATNEWQKKSVDDNGWQRNFDDLTFDIKKGMKPVKIMVERGVTFSGRVLDPDGKPVAGATVAPAKTGSGNSLTGDTRYSAKTRDDGSYEVVMPAGNKFEYNLIAHDGGYKEWRNWANAASEPLKTKPGQVVENFDLQLTKGGTIKGFVANPRKGLKVRAVATDMRSNRYYVPTVEPDEDGSFEIKFVRPGTTYVQVGPFWLNPTEGPEGSSVEVVDGKTIEEIRLEAAEE